MAQPLIEGTSDPAFDDSLCKCAFSTDLERMMKEPVKVWCFGHTHFSSDRIVRGVRVVSNQMGYRSMYASFSGFVSDLEIQVEV